MGIRTMRSTKKRKEKEEEPPLLHDQEDIKPVHTKCVFNAISVVCINCALRKRYA